MARIVDSSRTSYFVQRRHQENGQAQTYCHGRGAGVAQPTSRTKSGGAAQRVKLTRYGRTVLWLVPPEDGKLLDECASHLEQCRKQQAGQVRVKRPA